MKLKTITIALLVLLSLPALWAAQPQYSQGKLTQVERKTREKVTMYLVNNPVTSEVPYFQVMVLLDQFEYTGEYTPRHAEEQLPETWVSGADVMMRIEKHHLFLKRPDGSEMQWILLKKSAVKN